jgi:hypothetical protein
LDIDDESIVRMKVMLGVDMLMPWFVLDFEFGLANSANETDTLYFLLNVSSSRSFVSERVNDDTKENVHEDNVDDQEEGEIENISKLIKLIRAVPLPKSIANTTSTSHTKTGCTKQAINKSITVHVISSTR